MCQLDITSPSARASCHGVGKEVVAGELFWQKANILNVLSSKDFMPKKAAGRLAASKARQGASLSLRLDSHIFYLFGQISSHRNNVLSKLLRPFDLDYSKWRVLAVLNEHPGCSMLELAKETAINRTTLNNTINVMSERKLISYEERPSDRRSVVLQLTPKGAHLYQEILPLVLNHNAQSLKDFSSADLNLFVDQLRRLIKNFRDSNGT